MVHSDRLRLPLSDAASCCSMRTAHRPTPPHPHLCPCNIYSVDCRVLCRLAVPQASRHHGRRCCKLHRLPPPDDGEPVVIRLLPAAARGQRACCCCRCCCTILFLRPRGRNYTMAKSCITHMHVRSINRRSISQCAVWSFSWRREVWCVGALCCVEHSTQYTVQ
jgi:hypothetical protein